MRDGYVKCRKKIDVITCSGAGASKLPRCKLFTQLHFLKDTCSNRTTHSNMNSFLLEQNSFQAENDADNVTTVDDRNSSMATSSLVQSPSDDSLSSCSTISRKRKTSVPVRDTIDLLLVEAFRSEKQKKNSDSDDPDFLFCRSLVPALRKLPSKQNRKLKIEIQKLFLKYECSDESSGNEENS